MVRWACGLRRCALRCPAFARATNSLSVLWSGQGGRRRRPKWLPCHITRRACCAAVRSVSRAISRNSVPPFLQCKLRMAHVGLARDLSWLLEAGGRGSVAWPPRAGRGRAGVFWPRSRNRLLLAVSLDGYAVRAHFALFARKSKGRKTGYFVSQ